MRALRVCRWSCQVRRARAPKISGHDGSANIFRTNNRRNIRTCFHGAVSAHCPVSCTKPSGMHGRSKTTIRTATVCGRVVLVAGLLGRGADASVEVLIPRRAETHCVGRRRHSFPAALARCRSVDGILLAPGARRRPCGSGAAGPFCCGPVGLPCLRCRPLCSARISLASCGRQDAAVSLAGRVRVPPQARTRHGGGSGRYAIMERRCRCEFAASTWARRRTRIEGASLSEPERAEHPRGERTRCLQRCWRCAMKKAPRHRSRGGSCECDAGGAAPGS